MTEPIVLQGYTVTEGAGEQAIIAQGYGAGEGGPPSHEGRIVVNQTGATEQS